MNRITVLLLVFVASSPAAERCIVESGQPRAEIVIAETPQRTVRVAAQELQNGILKISGARLPIVTTPSGRAVKLFVGRSSFTDALKITAKDLKDGAYRLVSGDDWMVFLGDDSEFIPLPPFATNNGDIPRAQAEWEKLTGSAWGMPGAGTYKHRLRLPGATGKAEGAITAKNESLEVWGLDERGSFNAVCGFLGRLGARWYLPGELGEVWPALRTIALPEIDEIARPDFPLRQFNFRFGTVGYDTALWAMRLGMRNDERLQIAHGLATMTGRDAVFAAHPDWFALYGGKRDYTPGSSKNQLCYSNDELFRETVRCARAQLDTYKFKTVSIMPPDGYTAICQCPLCKGKDSPDRNERGLLSDYVWDFVNRVAREIAKTHPDARVLNCAYGAYTLPPLKIEKLEPNVVVCIVGGRRPINKDRGSVKTGGEVAPEALRAAWVKKTDNPILNFENYPFTDRGWYLPSFMPHALGETVNATKGISQGEDIWLSVRQDFDKVGIGFNHFLVYFTARMYWGGKGADVDAMFREYCRLFYGPAAKEMLEFFTYCEGNWGDMEEDKSKADAALDLFARAQAQAAPTSVHGRRMMLVDDFLKGLRMKSQQLAQKRGPVPVLRLVGDAENIVIDGELDDDYWKKCPVAATGRLRELQTGREPVFGTTFKAGWQGNSVCFAIRCEERRGEKPRITATRDDDQAVWYGDAIEIELATETRSYYQIAVSPSGAIVDFDRGALKGQWAGWDSKAEVAARMADDHWTVEIRIPVTTDENDPLHQVIGRKPTQSLPWHINICRQRVREDGAELSAFSPTSTSGFHEPMKFAHFYDGRSHQFDADETVTDFVIALRQAEKLRKPSEALPAYLRLAEGNLTDLQKATALEAAAAAACGMKDFTQASAIAGKIPIPAVKACAQMQHLLSQQNAAEVVAKFGGENIASWPFWKRGDGYFARGRAYAAAGKGLEADRDFSQAIEWLGERRTRDALRLALAQNREMRLKDDGGALSAYQAVIADKARLGSADEFAAVLGINRILARSGKFEEALAVVQKAAPGDLRGTWRTQLEMARADVLRASGQLAEARAAYQSIATGADTEPRFKKAAEEALKTLQ